MVGAYPVAVPVVPGAFGVVGGGASVPDLRALVVTGIPLRMVERPERRGHHGAFRLADPEFNGLEPGDCWREPELDADGREAWGIVLPNLHIWYTTDTAGGSRWDVMGTPPDLTVHPSLNSEGARNWHGWIRGGRLEDA